MSAIFVASADHLDLLITAAVRMAYSSTRPAPSSRLLPVSLRPLPTPASFSSSKASPLRPRSPPLPRRHETSTPN